MLKFKRPSLTSLFDGWVVPLAIYVSLVSGAGNPIRCFESQCEFFPLYLLILVPLVLAMPLVRIYTATIPHLGFVSAVFFVLCCVGYFSPLPAFVYSKAWGGFLATAWLILFIYHLVRSYGLSGFSQRLARTLAVILWLTILSKMYSGEVMDRDVPYLMNGPIVFGWLMALGALCSLYSALLDGSLSNLTRTVFLSIGVLWSGSKGPIVAFFISAIFLYWTVSGIASFRAKLIAAVALFGLLGILVLDVESLLSESRFKIFLDILYSGVDLSEGSVGVRLDAYESALSILADSIFFGIGPGGFAAHFSDLMYPHNVHLEILLEYGLLVFISYVSILVYAVVKGNNLFRSIVLFFAIALSFSGDLSYFRYILPFLILCTVQLSTEDMVPGRPFKLSRA